MLAGQGAPTLTDWLSIEEVQRSHASMLIAAQRVEREPLRSALYFLQRQPVSAAAYALIARAHDQRTARKRDSDDLKSSIASRISSFVFITKGP